MGDSDLRQLLARLDNLEEAEDTPLVTKLLRLAVALNEWRYPCVSRIECGFSVQDSNYVGDIELLLPDPRGTWKVTVRPSEVGDLVTFIDHDGAVDQQRERELKAVFENCGYVYMPPELLRERYPGEAYTTWFDRFFW